MAGAGWLPALLRIASDARHPRRPSLRRTRGPAGRVEQTRRDLFDFLLGKLPRNETVAAAPPRPTSWREPSSHLNSLADWPETLRSAGPVEVDRLLAAFEQSNDEALGLKLLNALSASPALSGLRADAVKAHLAKYPAAVQKEVDALVAKINVDAAKQKAQLEQLLPTMSSGDIRRGQLVFHSEKAACYSCHAIGYRGGNVGPDLTKIGSVRSERDLLEAIVFPSASLVRSFEPIAVATNDGKVYNGLLRGETADELRTGDGREPRGADRTPRDRRNPPQHRLDHARRTQSATDPSRTRRPGRVS